MARRPEASRLVGARAAAIAVVVSSASCGAAVPAAQPKPIEAKHVGTPSGVWFDEACTPTGSEVCGNATDDNCNGVIDEGCGLVVGRVQFEVAWSEPSATVDLVLGDPQGAYIDATHASTPSGFRRDRRCPQDGCDGQNVDNIVLAAAAPTPGLYTVDVRLADAGRATLPVKVRFGWRVGDRVSSTWLTLGSLDDMRRFTFEM